MDQNPPQAEQGNCRRCGQAYNDQNLPLYLGCTRMHCICSTCIVQTLENNSQQIQCPIDQEVIDFTNKTLVDFRRNRDLLAVVLDMRSRQAGKCLIHQGRDLDLFCIPCKMRVCDQCKRSDHHRFHKVDSLQNLKIRRENGFPQLVQQVALIAERANVKKRVCDQKQEELISGINDLTEYLCDTLRRSAEREIERIRDMFDIARQQNESLGEVENNIFAWRDETERLLNRLNDPEIAPNIEEGIAAELYNQELLAAQIDMRSWEEDVLNREESLKLSLQEIVVNKNEMLMQAIDNLPLFQFDPEKTSIALNTQDKFEFEQYVLKRKDPFSIKKVEKFFRPLQSYGISLEIENDLGSLEIKEGFTLNDELAQEINFLIQKADDPYTVETIQSKLKEVMLRCSDLTDKGMIYLKNFLEGLERLETLVIDFSNCQACQIGHLVKLLMSLRCHRWLRTLKLGLHGWQDITRQELGIITEVIVAFPELKTIYLDLSGCRRIGNKAVKKIFDSFSRVMELTSLTLLFKSCQRITNDWYLDVQKHLAQMECLDILQIDLRNCPRIVDKQEIKEALESYLPGLVVEIY